MSRTGHLSELDALRSQVADLSHQLAERDRSAQHQREQSDLLRAIVEGTTAETGEEFFSALVTHLTSVLHVEYAHIGEMQGDHIKKIRTLAVSAGGAIVDNFEYALAHTPCASALTQSFACFAKGLQTMFPQFTRLADLGAESYCGVPLRAKGGAVIGLLVVMDTKPLEHGDDLRSLLEVFAPRVAAEFEWRRAEQERAQALDELHNVIETIPDIVFALDTQGHVVKWNRRLGDVTGYSHAELLNKPALAFVPPEEQTRTAAAIQLVFVEGYAELECHLLTKEHRLIPYHWTGALLKNRHGEPIGITGIGRDVSEKKRAEGALRASEERYRSLYDDTPTMYLTLSTGGTVLSVNRFGAEQLGYRVEELIGRSVLTLFHECDKEAIVSSLSECLANPVETRHWAFRKVRKDGSIVWVRETMRVGQSSSGEPVVLVTCEDITEQRQAEHEVKLFRALLDQADDSIEIIDPATGRFLDSNEEAFSSLGYTRDEHRSLTVPDIDPIVTAPIFQQTMTQIRENGPLTLETVHRRKDGSTFPVEVKARLVQLDCEYLLAIVRDITERKRAGAALRSSGEKLRQALQASNTGLWDWNTNTNEVSFSKEWKQQLGYEEDEIADAFESWEVRLHPDDHDRAIAYVQAYLADPVGAYHQEFRLRHKDETYRWIEARASFVAESDGRQVRLLGSHTDITMRKRIEDVLRQNERDLRQALHERERISQDLHDGILQSLFAVGLALETTKSMMTPRNRKAFGPALDRAIKQLNLVMREIRNFIAGLGSDLLQGKDLSTALQQMLALLTQNQATRVRLAVESRAAKAVSIEQSLHLFHVIQEAVSNCIRHGRAQEARVSLKMLKQGVRLSIRDNGSGFNPEASKQSGHGLSNMAARARKIGGRFTVLSKVDEGTRVVLDLPKETTDVSC